MPTDNTITLNKAFYYKIRKCILFTDSHLMTPPAKSGTAPQRDTRHKTVHTFKWNRSQRASNSYHI